MSADPPIRRANPPPTGEAQRALIERQMAKLERLAEIGMEIAEAAGRRAAALAEGAGTEADAADPGLSFARAARAVRLTIALQSRLAADLAALDRADAHARTTAAARRRDRIHTRVEEALGAERDGPERDGLERDVAEVERLSSSVWERLTEVEDADILDRPIAEVVAAICQDLGLSPAWAAPTFAAATFAILDDLVLSNTPDAPAPRASPSPSPRGKEGKAGSRAPPCASSPAAPAEASTFINHKPRGSGEGAAPA